MRYDARSSSAQCNLSTSEWTGAEYRSAHPFINHRPFTAPSVEYRKLYSFMRAKKLNFKVAAQPRTLKEIVEEKWDFLEKFDFMVGRPASCCSNSIVDDIRVDNIRFCAAHVQGSNERNGGFLGGSHTFPLAMLSKMSQATGRMALSIDYRCPPVFPLPAAVRDIVTLYRWLCDHGKVRSQRKLSVTANCPRSLVELERGLLCSQTATVDRND